jgi:hypothetical protein
MGARKSLLKRWAILCRPETGLKQTDDASPHSTFHEFVYQLTYKPQGKVHILQIRCFGPMNSWRRNAPQECTNVANHCAFWSALPYSVGALPTKQPEFTDNRNHRLFGTTSAVHFTGGKFVTRDHCIPPVFIVRRSQGFVVPAIFCTSPTHGTPASPFACRSFF